MINFAFPFVFAQCNECESLILSGHRKVYVELIVLSFSILDVLKRLVRHAKFVRIMTSYSEDYRT